MNAVPPIEPSSPVYPRQQREQQSQKSFVLRKSSKDFGKYDQYYGTTLQLFLEKRDPTGARDSIKHSGLSALSVKIGAYMLIYSWLWNELSVTDVSEVTQTRVSRVLGSIKKFLTDRTPEFQSLMTELEDDISWWFEGAMKGVVSENHYREIGGGIMPLPLLYREFPSGAPEGSPLSGRLHEIFQRSTMEIPPTL
ncbi:MAG: hypothetical protein PHH70_00645 [Candidatus Gracilibacteria bacterium]|nr:hypothetical protein [Candidatus Gracilibacteria bacterium]